MADVFRHSLLKVVLLLVWFYLYRRRLSSFDECALIEPIHPSIVDGV